MYTSYMIAEVRGGWLYVGLILNLGIGAENGWISSLCLGITKVLQRYEVRRGFMLSLVQKEGKM